MLLKKQSLLARRQLIRQASQVFQNLGIPTWALRTRMMASLRASACCPPDW